MTRETIMSKTGNMNMGGYSKTKTSKLDKIGTVNYPYRVYYVGDSCDECYNTLDEAILRFNEISETIIN